MKKIILSLFLLVFVFVFVSTCYAATTPGNELMERLNTIVNGVELNVKCDSIKIPHKFDEYEDSSAEIADLASNIPSMNEETQSFIWRKDTNIVINEDKSIDITRKVIVYIGENVPERYRLICVPMAKGATLELLDAKIYDARNGTPISLLLATPVNLEGGGFALMFSLTDEAIGRVVVMSYKEHRAPDEYVSFYTEFADKQFPVWEQSLTVKTPKNLEIYLAGLNSDNPTKVEEADSTTYLWHNTNQLAVPENPFIEQNLPYVAFSNKLGAVEGIISLNDIFSKSYVNVTIPDEFKNKDFRELLGIIDDKNNTLPSIDKTIMRDEKLVPTKGPWTTWEKVAIIASYAKQLGAKVQFSYVARNDMTDKSSAARELFHLPILQITEKNGRVSYYVPDTSSCFDKYPPLVAGKVTYFERDGKLKKKTLKSLSSAANSLNFNWNLKMDENGCSTGTLEIDYAGIWQDLLVSGIKPTKENIDDFVKKAFTLSMQGLQLTCTRLSQKGSDKIHIDFDVKCQQAIIQGNRLLFRIPGGVPNVLLAFTPAQKNYSFRFPFSINQTANVTTPAGFKVIQAPSLVNTPAESSAFVIKQDFDYKSQWKRLELGSKLVVRLKEVTAEQAQFIGQQLATVCRWPMTDVGFIRPDSAKERQEKIMKKKAEKQAKKDAKEKKISSEKNGEKDSTEETNIIK